MTEDKHWMCPVCGWEEHTSLSVKVLRCFRCYEYHARRVTAMEEIVPRRVKMQLRGGAK